MLWLYMGFFFVKKMKNGCMSEYDGIKDQLCFQWNTNWHQLMWDLLLHGVVTLRLLSVSTCWVHVWFCLALFWAYLVKKKYFQKISSNNMCCTDVSWGNQRQEQEKPEDEWIFWFKIGNSLKFLWGETETSFINNDITSPLVQSKDSILPVMDRHISHSCKWPWAFMDTKEQP